MATGANRDVELGIKVKTDSSELEDLKSEFNRSTDAMQEFDRAAKSASADFDLTKRGLDAQREALARLRLDYRAGKVDAESFKTQEIALRTAILDGAAALRVQKDATQAARAAAAAGAAQQKQLADRIRETTAATRQQGDATRTVTSDVQALHGQLRTIQQLAGAALGGQLLSGMAGDVAKTADEFANLTARIKLTVGDGDALKTALAGVFEVAERTGTAFSTVGDLMTKLAAAGKSIGVSNQQALALTESIAQATQLSGASAEAANAAITQFVQGLQSGVLRGDEFNSVMEQTPRLARALADGLSVTTGELRKLAEAGTLTSQTVIGALQGQGAALRAEFEQLPPTIGRALTNLSSAWTQYIGEADKATGTSAAVAGALNTLAKNLDTVAALLIGAGKAAAAYQALKLAQTFTGIGLAARAATVEVAAFNAAQAATGTGAAGAAAGAGRLASAMSSLKAFGLIAIVANLKEIGTAIGNQIGEWSKYGAMMREAEARQKAEEEATRKAAQAKAELAQKMQIAADKALGLGVEAQALVGKFNQATQAGKTTADALSEVTKALDLSNVQGINAAISALDALAVRGQITSSQMREALSSALTSEDLGLFEARARAAFESGEIGARRFAAAVDALGDESLRRAGLSAQELSTGFGAATASAINDVDALIATLDRLGAKGPETGAAVAKSLDKATEAAGTERALQAVIQRFEELGKNGRLSGEQVAAGMEKARAKIDELGPGVSSLNEALRNFGIKTQTELQATADRFAASWLVIKDSTTVALADKVRAFEQYRDAATAANKGVETSEVNVQREMLRMRQDAAKTGDAFVEHMGRASRAVNSVRREGSDTPGVIGPNQVLKSTTGSTREERLSGQNAVDNRLMFELREKLRKGELGLEDVGALQTVIAALRQNALQNNQVDKKGSFISLEGRKDDLSWQQTRAQFEDAVKRLEAPARSTQHTVDFKFPDGSAEQFGMASEDDATRFVKTLTDLSKRTKR
ncbi:tape measure domain-containing protein [Variovorax boronicumulans]|uniref:tape measure protein n=1 Tax=Variovorax boronicumulans TaxID=436515 RepID=UPI0027841DF5|nr:tape measure protein [Variovorax boronicumulans]MDP9919820.1 tape measure domain-containing protein [Variovorax boronicumulans]